MNKLFNTIILVFCCLHLSAIDTLRVKELEQISHSLERVTLDAEAGHIVMPALPVGVRLVLRGTDCLPVVAADGSIGMPLVDKEVGLYFQLLDEKSDVKLDVTHQKVWVRGDSTLQNGGNACPQVIPSLQEWVGGKGTLSLPRRGTIMVDVKYEQELKGAAVLFAADLNELAGINYEVRTGKSGGGGIFMTLSTTDKQLGEEGYRLYIDDDGIRVEAIAVKGAFWATRTLLQMIDRQGLNLVKGVTRDYPKYSNRGFILDVARKFFRLEFLQSYVKIMSYYKMNEFQVHLNDNGFIQYFDNDWDKTYAAFRLECETFPGLTARDGHYTKAEFTALQRQGMDYGVNVFPEIDVPAHSLAFSHYRKSLGSKEYGMDHLDLFNPEVYGFVDSLFAEYLNGENPVFIGQDVHVGTDEYSKKAAEEFRGFTDHYLRYIQSFGKRARLWGALTHAKGETPVTSENVIMNAWYNGYADPKEMIEQGYDLMSTPDGWLYIVPAAGYYYNYLNLESLYENWEPIQIGKQKFPYGHPQILGGAFAVWNDHCGNGISEKDVHHRSFPAMQVLAEKMWRGSSLVAYESFNEIAEMSKEAPGVNLMGRVESKSELVLLYKVERGKLTDKSGNSYTPQEISRVKISKDGSMLFKGDSKIVTPLLEIGYDYSAKFVIYPAKGNPKSAILFRSPNAEVVINETETGKLAFKRDGYCYSFDYTPEEEAWSEIRIEGDSRGTSLFINGQLKERLEGQTKVFKDKNGKESKMFIQQTLVFPLQQIGDGENGFKGYIREIEIKKR